MEEAQSLELGFECSNPCCISSLALFPVIASRWEGSSFFSGYLCHNASFCHIMDSYHSGIIRQIKPSKIALHLLFYHSNRKVKQLKQKLVPGEWCVAVKNLTICVLRVIWKALEVWARKSVECCKKSLTSYVSRSLEESSAESKVVPEGNKDLSNNWDILVKHLAAIYPKSKTFSEVKLKNNELISLGKEMSKQPDIKFMAWLLMVIIM